MVVMLVLAGHARRGEAPAGRTVQQASAQLPCMRCPVPESTMNTSSDRPAQQASKQPTQATNTQTHTHTHSTTPAGGSAPWCEQDRLQNYEAQQARADARAAARARRELRAGGERLRRPASEGAWGRGCERVRKANGCCGCAVLLPEYGDTVYTVAPSEHV